MSPVVVQLRQGTYAAGLAFIIISVIVFLLPGESFSQDSFSVFAINFLLAATYFLICLFRGRFRRREGSLHHIFLFLILALVSAFSLNREMSVFQQSTSWMCILLVVCCINFIALAFARHAHPVLLHAMAFILGVSFVFFIYMSIYLLPLYGIGIVAFFILGISLHTFVPLLISIFSFVLLRSLVRITTKTIISFSAGAVVVLVIALVFVAKWNSVVTTINREYKKQLVEGGESLPAWVRLSQNLQPDAVTEKVLKAGLSYALPSEGLRFDRLPQRNFGQEQKHDPLVMASAMATSRVQMPEEERIMVLAALYDSRHQAERRLWSGENLQTDHVHTRVKVWSALRMAYTEQVITVTNTNKKGWGMSEEAIYTFHLPEGGVVSSLSLWINGKEEKAILTTKEKAANAYNTIVGVESRDPSVVHWQEGNRVSVRVFPVLPGESRVFKVGITSPVSIGGKDLLYSNIWFDGPTAAQAEEDVKVEMLNASGVIAPSSFDEEGNNVYLRKGNYNPEWAVSCQVQPVSPNFFAFDDHVYSVEEYSPVIQPADFRYVYLDINSSWSEEEMHDVWESVKDKQVYVSVDDDLLQVTGKNVKDVFAKLHAQRFSLFLFYKIEQPAQALVISKSGALSPNLDELKGTGFLQELQSSYQEESPYRLFNIGNSLSPFLASLREKRYFHYQQGSVQALKETIRSGTFSIQEEDEQQVIIHSAGIRLKKFPGYVEQSTAPDHLARLFTYNHIMQQLGANPYPDELLTQQLAETAAQANIVSPLSSLVVLESQRDYDRFDIKEQKNSLKNASMKSTGAVPEPHEWALIILAIVVLLYAKYPFLFKRVLCKA